MQRERIEALAGWILLAALLAMGALAPLVFGSDSSFRILPSAFSRGAPMVPELSAAGVSQREIASLAGLYSDAGDRLKAIVLAPPDGTSSSQAFNQARAAQLTEQVDRVLAELGQRRNLWTGANAPAAYGDGLARGTQQAIQAGVRKEKVGAIAGSFSKIDRDAVAVFARDIAADLAKAESSLAENTKAVLRTTAQQHLSESDIDKILAGGVIDGTPVQTIKALKQQLEAVAGKRIQIPTTSGNVMEFETGYYAKLVAVTKTRQAMVTGQHNRLQRLGMDLVSVIGAQSGNFCTAFLGQVFSLSGNSSRYPALASLPGGGPPFHPQCSKSTRPFVEDLATDEQLDNAEGLDDSHKLLGMTQAQAQRSYKDLQIEQQVASNYGKNKVMPSTRG